MFGTIICDYTVELFDGVPYPLAKIDVGHVVGESPEMHTIWVEMEYLLPTTNQNR